MLIILNWLFQSLHFSHSWVLCFTEPVFYYKVNVVEHSMFAGIVNDPEIFVPLTESILPGVARLELTQDSLAPVFLAIITSARGLLSQCVEDLVLRRY